MNRRIIILIIVIAVLGLAAAGLLWFVNNQHSSQAEANVPLRLQPVGQDKAVSPVGSFDGNSIWYFTRDSRLFQIKGDGTGLTEFPVPKLDGTFVSALWPKTGSDFISISTSAGQTMKSYYNFANKIYINFPANVQSIDWMPDGKRVIYVWKTSDNLRQTLVLANADGTGYVFIGDVTEPDLEVKASPDGKFALLYRSRNDIGDHNMYLADLEGKTITPIEDLNNSSSALWLPGGDRLIYVPNTGGAHEKMSLYSISDKSKLDLNLQTDFNKIVLDKNDKFLYAAVPKSDNSGDNFIKVDLNTLQQETYFEPPINIQATNLFFLGSTLYFVNAKEGKLYLIGK